MNHDPTPNILTAAPLPFAERFRQELVRVLNERKGNARQLAKQIGATEFRVSEWKAGKHLPNHAVTLAILARMDVEARGRILKLDTEETL